MTVTNLLLISLTFFIFKDLEQFPLDYILLYFLVQLFIQKLPVRIPAHESHPLVLILLYNISAGFAIAVLPG